MNSNHLITETSPYLLQHAYNPVDWYPWSNEALEKAKDENKLVIVSIGYAACHWCHVMEHESFEDSTVADVMNKYYVSIKVDREERPDVDEVYMDAANIMTGRGGWPLNIIALPDGRPIFAGTYFSKNDWLKVLAGVQKFYEETPEKAIEQAELIQQGVSQLDIIETTQKSSLSEDSIALAYTDWLSSMDMKTGGRRANMKFPMPLSYLAMLNYTVLHNDQQGKDAVLLTLNKMAMGGIYDQIGGGFSRYSVDPKWHVPHFEKMLYDNAQLITLYAEAFKLTKDPLYERVVRETVEFCNRELRSEEGIYYASLDADSEGEEGKFYVWDYDDIQELLGDDAKLFNEAYDVKRNGNWEERKNVLQMRSSIAELATDNGMTEQEIVQSLEGSKAILFKNRAERIRPALDDKSLTSWNALMVSGLTDAYEALGDESYREEAVRTLDFLLAKMLNEDRLLRNYKEGNTSINGFIEDYAFLIRALIDVYQITFNEAYLAKANTLTEVALAKYFNTNKSLFNFKSSDDEELYVSRASFDDNVIPSGNSQMAINLQKLGHLLYNERYIKISEEMMVTVSSKMLQQAAFYYNWFELYNQLLSSPYEVAIVGEDYESKRSELAASFLPNVLFLGGAQEGNLELLKGKLMDNKTMIYVCVDKSCQLPVEDPQRALKQMED